jgi:hypothetical protein
MQCQNLHLLHAGADWVSADKSGGRGLYLQRETGNWKGVLMPLLALKSPRKRETVVGQSGGMDKWRILWQGKEETKRGRKYEYYCSLCCYYAAARKKVVFYFVRSLYAFFFFLHNLQNVLVQIANKIGCTLQNEHAWSCWEYCYVMFILVTIARYRLGWDNNEIIYFSVLIKF